MKNDAYHLLGFAIAHKEFMREYIDAVKAGVDEAKEFLSKHDYQVDETWEKVIEILHKDNYKRAVLLRMADEFRVFVQDIPNPKV